ncbi:hypothetical protein [Bilophila wadsworthia]|uniref:hypothetical protein n=1 Tax=Bilophila wadsworthia TaxID=35833 RepID=UPI00352B95D6
MAFQTVFNEAKFFGKGGIVFQQIGNATIFSLEFCELFATASANCYEPIQTFYDKSGFSRQGNARFVIDIRECFIENIHNGVKKSS